MLITFADRLEMIATLSTTKIESMVELGVYKGEFAEFCHSMLAPEKQYLVDFWDYDAYEFVLTDSPQNAEREKIFEGYFDNQPRETLAAAYHHVSATFADIPNVTLIKADIAAAASQFPDESFDIIYLDGNHTYEFVLRDLYTWFPKLKPGGLFVCNDFYESALAAKQNIGVIPAFQTFSKRFSVYPIALSMADWSDFYFSNQPESQLITHFRDGLINSGHKILEVPDFLLGTYQQRLVTGAPYGQVLLPSFEIR